MICDLRFALSSSGKTSRAETSAFLLILKANLKSQIMSSQALKATVQQSVRMASQVVEQQVDTEEDLSGEPGLGTSTKVGKDSTLLSSLGGTSSSSKGRSGRVSLPRGSDGSTSIRVMDPAPSLQSSITFLSRYNKACLLYILGYLPFLLIALEYQHRTCRQPQLN